MVNYLSTDDKKLATGLVKSRNWASLLDATCNFQLKFALASSGFRVWQSELNLLLISCRLLIKIFDHRATISYFFKTEVELLRSIRGK